MSAPRIDTFRNTLDAVIRRIEDDLWPEVADLHDLAYNRTRAANEQEAKRRGGPVDYALDNHGDTKARNLYIAVANRMIDLARGAEDAAKDIRRHLNKQDDRPRSRTGSVITAAEFDEAMSARRRRAERGERHPHRVVAQPERRHSIDPSVELEQLRGAVRRLAAHLDREHRGCFDDGGQRKARWLDRSVLSPGQSDALDRALNVMSEEAS